MFKGKDISIAKLVGLAPGYRCPNTNINNNAMGDDEAPYQSLVEAEPRDQLTGRYGHVCALAHADSALVNGWYRRDRRVECACGFAYWLKV